MISKAVEFFTLRFSLFTYLKKGFAPRTYL